MFTFVCFFHQTVPSPWWICRVRIWDSPDVNKVFNLKLLQNRLVIKNFGCAWVLWWLFQRPWYSGCHKTISRFYSFAPNTHNFPLRVTFQAIPNDHVQFSKIILRSKIILTTGRRISWVLTTSTAVKRWKNFYFYSQFIVVWMRRKKKNVRETLSNRI